MKPIEFDGFHVKIAENQDEYITVPANIGPSPENQITACMQLSLRERLKILLTGKIFYSQLTLGANLSPFMIYTE